ASMSPPSHSITLPADAAVDPQALLPRGLEASHRGEYSALQTLTAAQQGFATRGNPAGAALCAAALMITGQALVSYRGFRHQIAALTGLRDGSLRFDDLNEDLLAHAGLLAGLLMLAPSDAFCDRCAARILALLELEVDVNLKFAAGRLVLYYTEPREAREMGQRVNALLQPLIDRPELTPHRLGRWLTFWIRVAANAKERLQVDRAKKQALDLVAKHSEPGVSIWLAVDEIDAALRRRDFDRIAQAIKTVESASDPASLVDVRRLAWLHGRIALARGEGDAALFHAARARKYSQDLELPPPMLGVALSLEAQARVLVGDFEGARRLFRETADMVAQLHAEEMRDMVRMVDACEALRNGRPDARALLAGAFAAPRARQFYDSFDNNPRFGAIMCAQALEHDVESEFARRIIEVNALAPPREAGPKWPWPLKIETLGRLTIACGGAPVREQGKAQRRPRDLLKVLIACGGRDVNKERLADLLWADADSDAAGAALDMAISRLRKLLAVPEAITIEDGKVGLDPMCVWVDVWALDQTVDDLQNELHGARADHVVAALGNRLLALYRGPFLESEPAQQWLLPARDRWRNRFLRSLSDAGGHWETRQRWSDAAALYERGITLAEDLYRRLMRCRLAQARPADAASVYRRCRHNLSVQLGIRPSAATEALFQSIYQR
ncbi:MAG TPA: bacterial transcriptional activator domain-containing protein, partial [Casimicrobiaceae bacterium]|nr:bacterial transcriptional activator domain-containing protein [Casimicrobiaceae bacterium]